MTAFHDDFSRALAGDPAAMAVRLGHDPHALTALRVYRNASLKGRVDARGLAETHIEKIIQALAQFGIHVHPPEKIRMTIRRFGAF